MLKGYFSPGRVSLRGARPKPQDGICWKHSNPLKGTKCKIAFAATHSGLWKREGSADWNVLRRVGGMLLWGKIWEDSRQDPCTESIRDTGSRHLFWVEQSPFHGIRLEEGTLP